MIVTFIFIYVGLSSAAIVLGRLLDQEQKILKLLSPSYKLGGEGDLPNEGKLMSMLSPSLVPSLADLPKLDLGPEIWQTLTQLSEKYPDKEVQIQIEFNNDGKPKKPNTGLSRPSSSGNSKRPRPAHKFDPHPVPMMPVPINRSGLKIKDFFKLLGVKELKTIDGEIITADDEGRPYKEAAPAAPHPVPGLASPAAAPMLNQPARVVNSKAPGAIPPESRVTQSSDLADEATRPVVMKDLWMHMGKCNGHNQGQAQHQQHRQGEGNKVGLQGGTSILEGGTNDIQGGTNGLEKGTSVIQGGIDDLKGGTNSEDEYDEDQGGAAEEFIRMIREKVTVKRVSPRNQRTKWYKLMAAV